MILSASAVGGLYSSFVDDRCSFKPLRFIWSLSKMCKFPDSASCARTRRPHQPLSTRRRAAAFLQFFLSLTSFDGPAHDRTSLNLKTAPFLLAHGRTFPFVRSIQRVAETRDALLKKLAEKGGSDPWGTLSLDGMQARYFNGEISQVGILKAVDERLTQLYQMMRRRFSSNGCGPGVYKFEWSKEDEDDNPKLAAWRALSEVPGAADAKQKRRDEITDSFSLTIVFDPSGGEGGGGMTSKSNKGSIVLRDEKARKQAEFGRLQDTRRIAMEKALLAASNGNFDLPKLKNPLTTEDAKRKAAEFADGLSNSLSKLEKVGRGTFAAGALDSVKKNQQFTFKDVKQFVKSIFPTGAKDGGNADYEMMIDIIFPPDEAEEENLLDEIAKIKGKVNADALEKPSVNPSIGDPNPIKRGDVGGPPARGRGDAVTVTNTKKSSMSMSRVDNKQAANPIKATEPGPNPSKKGQSRGDKKSSGASSFAQAQSASSTPKVVPGAGTATATSSTPKQVAPGAGTATATSADKIKRKPKTLADILNLRRVLSPRERKALHLRDKFQDFPLSPEGANILAANHDVRCDTVTVGLPFGASLRTAGTLACRQGRLVLAGDEISGTFLAAAAPSDASNSLFSDEDDQSGENAEKTAAVMDARSQQWTRTVDDLFEGASKEFYELNPDAPLNLNGNRFLERLRDGNSCLEVPTEVYEHGEPPADSLDPIQMQQFTVDPLYFYQTLNLDPNKFGKGGAESDDKIKAAFHEVEQRYKEAKDAKSLKKVILGDDGFAQSLRESDPAPLERTGDVGVANFVELQMNKAREAYLHLFSAKARQRYKNEGKQYVQVGSRAVAVNFLGAKLDRVRLCLRNARCFECSIMPRHWGEHCLLDSGDQSFFQENLRKMEVTGQDGVVAKMRMKLSHFLQNLGDAQFESGKALSTMDRIKDTIRDYNNDLEVARSEISADIPRHLNSMGTNMQRYKRAVQESFEARGMLDPSELKYNDKKTDNADAALRDSTTGKTEFDQVPTGEWITRRKTPQDWRHMRKNGISPLKPRRRCRMSQLVSQKEHVRTLTVQHGEVSTKPQRCWCLGLLFFFIALEPEYL